MELPPEIKAAALELVKAMKQDSTIRLYLSAKEAVENDPEASALESRLLELYEDLIQRQSRGEELSEEHIRAFNALRYQVRFHPLIARRENALAQIKPYLAQIAEEISDSLGIDYTILADAQCRGCS
ncbi:MAG: YlbF family regulator [Anaerolineales bacterium]|nr:YlbF family regulator [Anaerolineales bacterium]MDW8447260.1 YlbF family regulator [Anaerolineales bacterium]